MMNHDLLTAVERLNRFVAEDRVIRGAFAEGHDRACLLAALAPHVAKAGTATVCPSSIMPQWMAILTPAMDDGGTATAWPEFVRRYAKVLRRCSVLDEAGWTRADYRVRAGIVRIARENATTDAHAAIDDVLALLDEAAGGGDASRNQWAAAGFAAHAVAYYAADVASGADADAAARAAHNVDAEPAACSAYYAAADVYAAAFEAASYAADAAKGADADAAANAHAAAWDRINNAILNALDQECDRAEKVLL